MAKTIYRVEYRQVVSRLRDARETLGLSQTELASRLGRKQQWISLMESGSRRLDVVEFAETCLALKVDPTTILQPVVDALSGIDAEGSRRRRPKARK